MKKIALLLITVLLATTGSLIADTKAVVFDFGGVMKGKPNKVAVVEFLCVTFDLSDAEYEKIKLEKRQAIKSGKSDVEFWLEYAEQQEIPLPCNWPQIYKTVLQYALNLNPEMYALVAEIKAQLIPVALLSNTTVRRAKLVRELGLYEPFNPCLLSCEIGVRKPDSKAYQILLKELNFPYAKDVLFIDDRQENVDAALRLGIDAILFTSTDHLRCELCKRGIFSAVYSRLSLK